MKDQCFGVEVEFTGITREQAAIALANYFGTTPRYKGGTYGTWVVRDTENKEWKLVSDASIQGERKTPDGYARTGDRNYWVEMVSPKLTYRQNGLPVEELKKAWEHCAREVDQATVRINQMVGKRGKPPKEKHDQER